MPNIGKVLKDEISRLSKRETRQLIKGLAKAVVAHRHDIAALKRRIAILESSTKRQLKVSARSTEAPVEQTKLRFSPSGLRSMRNRLGLSASGLGKLIGVSEQSIYNWEANVSKPRQQYVQSIAALRKKGKREIKEMLTAKK